MTLRPCCAGIHFLVEGSNFHHLRSAPQLIPGTFDTPYAAWSKEQGSAPATSVCDRAVSSWSGLQAQAGTIAHQHRSEKQATSTPCHFRLDLR